MNSKIVRVDTVLYRIPLPVTLSDSTHGDMTHFDFVTVRVFGADGAEGSGWNFSLRA